MHKHLVLFIVYLLLVPNAHSQGNRPDTLVWYGIDYSKARFIGAPSDFSDLDKIQNTYFETWNYFVITEKEKYDIGKAFGVRQVEFKMDKAIERSKARSMEDVVQISGYELGKEELGEVIKDYMKDCEGHTGALMIMETLNKTDVSCAMWLVVFSCSSGEIHHLKKYIGTPGGFGFRNYWARGIYEVLNTIKKTSRKPF